MDELDIGALFLLGLFGTGHCLGMCGPLVVSIASGPGQIIRQVAYHLGRVCTYVGIGAVVGGIGATLSRAAGEQSLEQMARAQIAFSLVAAFFLLVFGLFRLGVVPEPRVLSLASPIRLPGFQRILTGAVQDRRTLHTFVFGLMMGFLPCGLSYAAFARSLAAGSAREGGLLAFVFGLGTMPGLFLLGVTTGAIHAQTAARASHPGHHVYLLRGLLNIFSLGLDEIAAKLQQRGINATVHNHSVWPALAEKPRCG